MHIPNFFRGWCLFQKSNLVSHSAFVIVDGISIDTINDISCNDKKVIKFFGKLEGNSKKRQLDDTHNSCKKMKINNNEDNKVIINGCSESKAKQERLSDKFNICFNQLSKLNLNCVEVVSPANYDHSLLDDLLYVAHTSTVIYGKIIQE